MIGAPVPALAGLREGGHEARSPSRNTAGGYNEMGSSHKLWDTEDRMTQRKFEPYGGRDPRTLPRYGVSEAARCVVMPPATIRSWVIGREYPRQEGPAYFEPLVRMADEKRHLLSFENLIELHTIKALRTEHAVRLKDIRTALKYAEDQFHIDRLLLRKELRTAAGSLFLDKLGELVNLSKSGQLSLKTILDRYLVRIEWEGKSPARLFPVYPSFGDLAERKIIAIDPFISFGHPIVRSKGISTSVIVSRIDAGEDPDSLASDYDLDRDEITEAILYERAA